MAQKKAIVDGSSSDGTLPPADFVAASHVFVDKWKSISNDLPPWSWASCKSTPLASSDQVDGYVAMEKMCLFKPVEATMVKLLTMNWVNQVASVMKILKMIQHWLRLLISLVVKCITTTSI